MNHQQVQDILPFYIAQTLPAAEQRAVEAHLAECDVCQQEVSEWRSVASAVWTTTDAVARQLPPLSPEVYNRLSYRDAPPRSRHSANPPRPAYSGNSSRRTPARPPQRSGSAFALPFTLVAGLVMAVFAGGLLITMTGYSPGQQGSDIALNATQPGSSVTMPTQTPLPTITRDGNQGILPTPLPTVTPLPPTTVPRQNPDPAQLPSTVTPFPQSPPGEQLDNPSIPPNAGGGLETRPDSGITASVLNPTLTPVMRPENSSPLITLTPGLSDGGAPLCYAVNPTDEMLPLRPRASFDDPPGSYIMPGDRLRTLVRSADGWYQVRPAEPRGLFWLAPQDAILEGNCVDLWLATPTVTAPAEPTDRPASGTPQPLPDDLEAIVMESFLDLRAEPRFDAPTVTIVERGDRLDPVARSADGQWLLLRLPDGRDLWALADAVRLNPRLTPPPTGTTTN